MKRASLVVVFSTIKVFLRPNGVIISLRQRSVVGSRQRGSVNRDGPPEAHSLFLRSFDFHHSIAFKSTT